MVHRRELNGTPVVFGNQGDLWNNAMTWFDHDTGSIWSQVTGTAIMGPLAGQTLELLPSTLTTWSDWQSRFPETSALDKFTRETRFTLDDTAVVVAVNGDSLAVEVPALRTAGVVHLEVGGEPAVVLIEPGAGQALAFSEIVDDRTVVLELVDGHLLDGATGHRWDARRGLPLGDQPALERLPSFSAFPADYARIFPNGRFWTPEGVIPADEYTDTRSLTG